MARGRWLHLITRVGMAAALLCPACSRLPGRGGAEPAPADGLVVVDTPALADAVATFNRDALATPTCPAAPEAAPGATTAAGPSVVAPTDPAPGCDGPVLAACHPNAEGGFDLCSLGADGSGERRTVSFGAGTPLPSPDGTRVIVTQFQRPTRLAAADGTPLVASLPDRTGWFGADRLIARAPANDRYLVLDLAGTVTATVADDPGFEARPNERVFPRPDGRAFLAAPITPELGRRVWLHRFDTGTWTPFGFGPGALQIGAPPNWSPDGATVFLTIQTAVGDQARPGDLRSELRAVDVATGSWRVVARFAHVGALSGVLSPDGRLMAERGEEGLVVVDVATGRASNRVVAGATNQFPSLVWSPAGDRLALEIGGRVAVVNVGPDLRLTGPSLLSTDSYRDVVFPLWPRR